MRLSPRNENASMRSGVNCFSPVDWDGRVFPGKEDPVCVRQALKVKKMKNEVGGRSIERCAMNEEGEA